MARNQIQDLFNVNGMVAVVTGGGFGLGLYAARALDANGAKAVYIVGRRENTLNETAKSATNGNIIPIVGDVTNKSSLAAITERIRKDHGYVNFLFANAGVAGPRLREYLPKKRPGEKPTIKELQDALWKPEMDEFSNALHVNCTGVFYNMVAFFDLLDAGNKIRNIPQDSQILVTSSVAAFSQDVASSFACSTSKAAINHLVKMISTLCAQNGYHIRCSSMASLDKFSGVEGHEHYFNDARKMPLDKCPAERTGSEEDIAGAILFLASRAGSYVNEECLMSDGGRLPQLPAAY